MVLQRLGNLYRTRAISICLNHADQLRGLLQERAKMIQVVDHRIEVHLKDCLMHFLHKQLAKLVKPKPAGTLQQDYLIAQRMEHATLNKGLYRWKETLLRHFDGILLLSKLRADTNQLGHTTLYG